MSARRIPLALLLAACVAAQCNSGQEPLVPTPRPPVDASDADRLARLEREARAIARAEGCSGVDQCRTAPVGERPCGGPRTYIVYCVRTTDSTALYRKLAELRQAETEYNRKNNIASTCEFRMPPEVDLVGGSCVARP
jgi:hypothetical protein